jgi:ribosome-associated toxin RatA of RatAB toxin-antitoxin module
MKSFLHTPVLLVVAVAAAWTTTAGAAQAPAVAVRSNGDGVYAIVARFSVPESTRVVQAVLTDYPNIPRFMPTVRTSRILEQTDGRVRVEQQAVSKFMMISRTVHLVLDVEESEGAIRFRDSCHKSFVVYEGSWTITSEVSGTELVYELTAKPAFGVPGMVLRKLLDRDAREMIDGLRAEIARRASSR